MILFKLLLDFMMFLRSCLIVVFNVNVFKVVDLECDCFNVKFVLLYGMLCVNNGFLFI